MSRTTFVRLSNEKKAFLLFASGKAESDAHQFKEFVHVGNAPFFMCNAALVTTNGHTLHAVALPEVEHLVKEGGYRQCPVEHLRLKRPICLVDWHLETKMFSAVTDLGILFGHKDRGQETVFRVSLPFIAAVTGRATPTSWSAPPALAVTPMSIFYHASNGSPPQVGVGYGGRRTGHMYPSLPRNKEKPNFDEAFEIIEYRESEDVVCVDSRYLWGAVRHMNHVEKHAFKRHVYIRVAGAMDPILVHDSVDIKHSDMLAVIMPVRGE